MAGTSHQWSFFSAGGFDQVRLESGADIASLGELDPKLWVALACPTKGLELDPKTLALLDTDGDGRVRVPEVVAAAKWATSMLKTPDSLIKGLPTLPLSAINDASPEGAQVLASAKEILKNLGKADAKEISCADTADTVKIFSQTLFNGDGVVPAESAEGDAATTQVIKDVMATVGVTKDASGKDGITKAQLDAFFTEAKALLEWWQKGEADAKAVLPLKDDTRAAYDALAVVRGRIDDYFARCALAAYDAKAQGALNPPEAQYVALATAELGATHATLKTFPLARAEALRPLPLEAGVNPAWAAELKTFREKTVTPLLGQMDALTHADWLKLTALLAPHQAWLATRPPGKAEALGIARVRALVNGDARAKVEALLAKDQALEPQAKAIAQVDRLAHYAKDLGRFLDNFVSFRTFYGRQGPATFQAGTLYLDGRSCDLCLWVDDPGKHAALAGQSMAYLAYCELTRKGSAEKRTVAAAFTGGDSDFLMVGRNGVFYDRAGQDWDATITKVVEQPISLRQAFWSPYKRLGKFVSDSIEKFAGDRDKEASVQLNAGVASTAKADPAAKEQKPPVDIAKFVGIFAAIGLAVGAVGSAAAAIVSGFLQLAVWQMPIAIAGAMLLISGPSMLLAAMKLRQRNLAPLLDASGWAINTRARINLPFGASLTHLAQLPKGSSRSLEDPFAEKGRPWGLYLFLAAVVGAVSWLLAHGYLDRWIEQMLKGS